MRVQISYAGVSAVALAWVTLFSACGTDSDASGSAGASNGGNAGKVGAAGGDGAVTAGAGTGGASGASNDAGGNAGGEGPSEGGSAGEGGIAGEAGSGEAGAATSGGTGGASGGSGGTAGGTAGAAGATALTCGAAPYAHANVAGNVLLATPTSDITVTGSLCNGTQLIVPAKGSKLFDVPNLTPIYFKATQTGSYNGLSPEFKLDKDGLVEQIFKWEYVNVMMVATTTDYTLVDPGWSTGTHAVIIVGTAKADGGTNGCANVGGITYTVTGHNEALVKYSGNGTSTPSDTGYASIFLNTTGTFASPELVNIVGTKAGCSVKISGFASGGPIVNQTGKIPVAGNVVSGVVTAGIGN